MEKLAAVILMAGSSVRFGGPKNKLLCLLNSKPVFSYSLDTFAKHKDISELVLVVGDETEAIVQKYVDDNHIKATLVHGGSKRQESVSNGLRALDLNPEDIVIVHDAARPLIDEEIINKVIESAREVGACTAYIDAADTIAIKNKNEEITSFIYRESIAQIQTPQAFKFAFLKSAHQWAQDANATDDCSLILMEGHKVKLVKGKKKFHKITTQEDILYLEGFLK